MKNTDNFRYKGKPSCTTTKLTLFTVGKDEWDTKKNTGKFKKNALYVLKGTSRAEATLNSENIKPVTLVVIELCLSEGISKSVRQSVENFINNCF